MNVCKNLSQIPAISAVKNLDFLQPNLPLGTSWTLAALTPGTRKWGDVNTPHQDLTQTFCQKCTESVTWLNLVHGWLCLKSI